MTTDRNFLVSVATAIGRDAATGQGLFYGKTNISSAFTLTTTAQEVRGGINNPLLYIYYHSKKLEIKIEDATFNKTFLGLNAGQISSMQTVQVVQTDCLTLNNGVGTLSYIPVTDVCVFLADGTIQNITPVGQSITVSGGGTQSVTCVYDMMSTVDQLTVETSTPPKLVNLTLIAELRDGTTGQIANYLQIVVPQFQISGNYTLSFAANGVATNSLDGMAIAVRTADCTTGDYFAKIRYMPAAASSTPVTAIVALPATLIFSVAAGLPSTKPLSVLSIQGNINNNVTTSASFTTSGSYFTVGLHTGLVTGGSNVTATTTGSVVVSYSSGSSTFTDSVNLTGAA